MSTVGAAGLQRDLPSPTGGAGRHDRGERFGARGGVPGLLMLFLLVLGTLALGRMNAALIRPELAGWFQALAMPAPLLPARWLAPIWTTLYAAMAVAAWRIWLRRGGAGLAFWALQLLLNVGWVVVFFGLHAPGAGLAVIVLLWAAILRTIALFRPLDGLAAALMMPYLAWVTYGVYLNAGVAWLN